MIVATKPLPSGPRTREVTIKVRNPQRTEPKRLMTTVVAEFRTFRTAWWMRSEPLHQRLFGILVEYQMQSATYSRSSRASGSRCPQQ